MMWTARLVRNGRTAFQFHETAESAKDAELLNQFQNINSNCYYMLRRPLIAGMSFKEALRLRKLIEGHR